MENNIKITYPGSEKVYMKGRLYPDIRVGMRVVHQMPTVTIENGERVEHPNPSVYVYDTSGPYSDPNVDIDVKKGLPRLREPWILKRGGVERLAEISSEYGRMRRVSSISRYRSGPKPVVRLVRCIMQSKVL